jgi:hypothetical protein
VAERVRVGSGVAKIRNLWIVALLLFVTLGIYYLFWYYRIKRELRAFGAGRDPTLESISPAMGMLAMTLGWFVLVPPFVSAWRAVRHVQLAERLGGIQPQHAINHTLGFVLFVFGFLVFPIEVFYLQLHLNRLWRHVRDEQEKQQLGMRGVAAT